MNLATTIWAYGTPEGVEKAWDTRGRGRTIKQYLSSNDGGTDSKGNNWYGYKIRGSSPDEVKKVFTGGELGSYWGQDPGYSLGFGGDKRYLMVAQGPVDKATGRALNPEPEHVAAIFHSNGKLAWDREGGFRSDSFKKAMK